MPTVGAHSYTDSQPWQHMSPEKLGGSELLIWHVPRERWGRGMFQTMLNADMNLFRRRPPVLRSPALSTSLPSQRRSHFWTSREKTKRQNLAFPFPSCIHFYHCSPALLNSEQLRSFPPCEDRQTGSTRHVKKDAKSSKQKCLLWGMRESACLWSQVPGKRKTFYSKYKCRKNTGFDNWLQRKLIFLLLYPTKQIADNFNQDKMQILKIRK